MIGHTGFQTLLQPDWSVRDWPRRHSIYWLFLIPLVASSWVYWNQSFQQALACALFSSVFRYIPGTYGFLYFVMPKLMQNQYRAVVGRLVIWLAASFALRFLLQSILPLHLLLYCTGGNLADTTVTDSSVRHLFDPSFMVTNSLVIVAASLKMFRYQYQKEQANQQLARETLSIELQLLKAQVQPHFLFNTLNNIYSLTLLGSEKAGEAVRKLSALLGYMFLECDKPEVTLRQEVKLLRNYTALEQIRYGHRLTATVQICGSLANKQIAPLLLIPFVENAFKHGASEQTDQAVIDIRLFMTGNLLTFRIVNTRTRVSQPLEAGKPGGLGLQNVQMRLQLLYPDRHSLTTRAEADRYVIDLTILLNPAWADARARRTFRRPLPAIDYLPQTA